MNNSKSNLKLTKSNNFISKQKDFENIVKEEIISLSVEQRKLSTLEFGYFKDNNHFLGVLMEEVEEAIEENLNVTKLYLEIKQKVYDNELEPNNILLTNIKIACLKNIIENIQIISTCQKYESS